MKIRTSRALDKFAKRASETLGLKLWEGVDDKDKDLLFFGLYNERDYEVFDNFEGNKSVLWGGGDISRLLVDYERQRMIKNNPAQHYCENEVEAKNLNQLGIKATIVPTFLDNINNFPVTFKPSRNPNLFMCVNTGREEEYGVSFVKSISNRVPFARFHIYGIEEDSMFFKTSAKLVDSDLKELNYKMDLDNPNVFYHGKVPEAQFNNEIMGYQAGLRPNFHDGNSEVTMKSILNGGYPITRIKYPDIWNYETEEELIGLINKLALMRDPNYQGRSAWIKRLNNFPFNKKNYYES
jgi:hypothetical protein